MLKPYPDKQYFEKRASLLLFLKKVRNNKLTRVKTNPITLTLAFANLFETGLSVFEFSSPEFHGLQILRRVLVLFQLSQNLERCLLAGRQLQRVIYKFSKSFEGCVRDVTKFQFLPKSQFWSVLFEYLTCVSS